MKGRQLTDVSRRRFDVSQSPVQLQGSPDFGRLRDSSSPFSSLLLLFPSFLRQPRPPSFQLLRSHPFSSVNEPVERKGERVVEQRESKLRPVPGHFLSLPLTRARAGFLFLFFCFFPPSLLFLFLFASPSSPPSAQISRHNRRSEPKLSILEINGIIIITSLLFLLSETMRNRERGEGEGGSDIYYIRKIGNWSREFDE